MLECYIQQLRHYFFTVTLIILFNYVSLRLQILTCYRRCKFQQTSRSEIQFKVKFESCDFVLIKHVQNFEKENTIPETIREISVASCSKPYARLNFTAISVPMRENRQEIEIFRLYLSNAIFAMLQTLLALLHEEIVYIFAKLNAVHTATFYIVLYFITYSQRIMFEI